MSRVVCTVLILCLAYGSVDAANDVEIAGACDERMAHDMHNDWECSGPGDENPQPGSESHPHHYCHCAVHAPAVPASAVVTLASGAYAVPWVPTYLHGTGRLPPPVRPPKP